MRAVLSIFVCLVLVMAITAPVIEACVKHDGACRGDHNTQGDCCAGTYCHKNNPSWAQGRCYYPKGG